MSKTRSTRFQLTNTQRKRLRLVLTYLIALFSIAFALFPILWIISASLNPLNSLSTQTMIPRNASFQNYRMLLTDSSFSTIYPFRKWLFNSVKIASITTIISVAITTTAAYSFSRFRFRQRENMLRGILLVQMFPNILVMVAVFLLIQQIGGVIPSFGLNTHNGLILVYLGGAMGINIWLMKGYFDTIPKDIDESAMVDGATHWQIFTKLLLPLMRPIIVVVAVLSFIFVYSDFVIARILLKTTEQYPLTVGLYIFTSGQFTQQWGIFAAGALMGALPIVIIYLTLQDQITGGLTQGAVKG
ncbi:MAG: maltose ABC transporter permease MalG [Anaerolineales bacterium]|nr:maltose ABC transporter permease MalG [Anaerolineales bacterium]